MVNRSRFEFISPPERSGCVGNHVLSGLGNLVRASAWTLKLAEPRVPRFIWAQLPGVAGAARTSGPRPQLAHVLPLKSELKS